MTTKKAACMHVIKCRVQRSKIKSDIEFFLDLFIENEFLFFRISPRTPVTQNDPLGALDEEEIVEDKNKTPKANDIKLNHSTPNNNNNMIYSDKPILFKGQRSATFDESTQLNKSISRSETMPGSSVASSLANLGSTLKFNFR